MKRAEDAQQTQKISREQLDEALKRTKSGTRRAVRSDPSLALPPPEEIDRDAFFGPRDDSAPMLEHIDPSSLSPMVAAPAAPQFTDTEAVTAPAGMATLLEAAEPVAPVAPAAAAARADDGPIVEIVAISTSPSFDVIEPPTPPEKTLQLKPRTAFVVGVVFVVIVTVAALVGFFAGRTPHP